MKWISLVASAFIVIGCCQNLPDEKKLKSKSELAAEAQRNASANLYREQKLRTIGTGSQMMDQIKMLGLSLCYYESIDEEKARELLLTAIDELISSVNKNDQIHPYLYNYPFDTKNIEIAIFLYNPDGSKPSAEKLFVVSASNGILEYQIDDPKNVLFTTVLKESYEEAVQKHNRKKTNRSNLKINS